MQVDVRSRGEPEIFVSRRVSLRHLEEVVNRRKNDGANSSNSRVNELTW